jgi:uncharacterized protein YbjT (DUF2867 family)
MEQQTIVVTGATGHIGRVLSEALLRKGRKVRAVARTREPLQDLARLGAEIFQGSLENPSDMQKAFQGAGAAFILIPPNFAAADLRAYQNQVGETLAKAAALSGVRHLVTLSSVGAHLSDKVGPIGGLYDNEQRFNRLDANVLHLRPAFFMENHLWGIGLIKQAGIYGTPLRPDLPLAMIATKDIGEVAAQELSDLGFKGHSVRELLGPREYTMTEVTAVLGQAVGRPDLKYIQFPYEDAENGMRATGMSADSARTMVELHRSLNEGIARPTEARSARNTTPTTIEAFSKTFAAVYGA